MADNEVQDAEDDIIENGSSRSHDGRTITAAPLSTIHMINKERVNDTARTSGARPLFRGIDLRNILG